MSVESVVTGLALNPFTTTVGICTTRTSYTSFKNTLMFLLRRPKDAQRQGTCQVHRDITGISREVCDLHSTVPERTGTILPGRLRRMEVAAAARRRAVAGSARVKGTKRGIAQVLGHLLIFSLLMGRGFSGC